MDTLPTNVVSSRKRRKSNSSSYGDQDSDVEDIYFPEWNLVWPRYIVLSPLDDKEPLTKLSPFAVEKGIQGKFGTVHKVTKMRSGSLLIEATRAAQARNILDTTKFMDIEVKATPPSLPEFIEGSDKRSRARFVRHVGSRHRHGIERPRCRWSF